MRLSKDLHSDSAGIRIPAPVLTRGGKPRGLEEVGELQTLVPAALEVVDELARRVVVARRQARAERRLNAKAEMLGDVPGCRLAVDCV